MNDDFRSLERSFKFIYYFVARETAPEALSPVFLEKSLAAQAIAAPMRDRMQNV